MTRFVVRPLALSFALLLLVAGPVAAEDPSSPPRVRTDVSVRWWGQVGPFWQYGYRPPIYGTTWRITGLDPADTTPGYHYPGGVAVDASGHVYVTDVTGDQVLKFDDQGNLLKSWGKRGSGEGQFDAPSGIALDADGNVLVVDSRNNRVQVFSPAGDYLAQWGSVGTGLGEFNRPIGIAVGATGNIYVADTFNDRMEKFAPDHSYLTQWGGGGAGDGKFARPVGVTVGANGDIYVTDNGNRLVQRFSAQGTFIDQWGNNPWWYWDGSSLNAPTGITADGFGNIFVADTYHNQIKRFDLTGNLLSVWGKGGATFGRMASPTGVAVDAHERVFVADSMNNRVQRWDPCCGLTIGGDWELHAARRFTIVGALGSFVPACAADRPISLLSQGVQVAQANTAADGSYRFDLVAPASAQHWLKLTTHFDGATLPGAEDCPPADSPEWWVSTREPGPVNAVKAAQSALRNALAAAKTYYTDADTYAGFDSAEAAAIEPSLTWVDATQPSGRNTVDVQLARNQVVLMIAKAQKGPFFAICDRAAGRGTSFGRSNSFTQVAQLSKCRGNSW